jgi:hypothetical protein
MYPLSGAILAGLAGAAWLKSLLSGSFRGRHRAA